MKKGSALLIVLGMLSFMVISAVAFSAYMRHSRLPSSYLRRTSSSRLLVKAALAEAIDMVDASIGNDRYPGMGDAGGSYRYPRATGRSFRRNYWRDRCFVGTNRLMETKHTVSTLNVEGLAYLPPPLINDARYYSRRATSAAWHSLSFDSGRFAFSAYDVTDCLDINKLFASYGRDSSDRGRISLSFALENDAHSGYLVPPNLWDDQFMERFRDVDTGAPDPAKVPLVSMADFNLALANAAGGLGALVSPFCRYVKTGAAFVQDEAGADANMQRAMSFITDSWFPQTNPASGTAIDLSNSAHQPFYGFGTDDPKRNDVTVDRLAQENSTFLTRYQDDLAMPEVVQLHDYLDLDSVPTSLALPTTERTPMVTGLSLEGALETAVASDQYDTEPVAGAGGQTKYVVKTYTVKLNGELTAMAGFVFPFKYTRGSTRQFKAQAFATVTFVPSNADNLRPGSSLWATLPVWDASQGGGDGAYAGQDRRPSGKWLRSAQKQLTLPTDVTTDQDCVLDDVDLPLGSIAVDLASQDGLPETHPGIKNDKCTLRVIKRQIGTMQNGVIVWTDDDTPPEIEWGALPSNERMDGVVTPAEGGVYTPTVQVWVRITDPDNNVVDLVPACAADDPTPSEFLTDVRGSAVRPALRFRDRGTTSQVKLESNALTGGGAADVTPKAYMVNDPRFNYAPENFWAMDSIAGDFKTEWYTAQKQSNNEGDIFMTTSDAGYLQSPYELANLLRITGMPSRSDWGALTGGGYDGKAATGFGDAVAADAMWTTYSQYDVIGGDRSLEALGMRTGSRGFRMTPYAASADTMMAVVANTPLDWWVASTNDQPDAYGTVKQNMLDSITEANKYTFSKHSGAQAQVEWDKLRAVADTIRNSCRGSGEPWERAYDNMAWDDANENSILGVDLGVPLHSVDRKFLHGFWKECLSNRQQLFLIFVRAEPMMMGGGALGQTPPQLGGRAVALVWRDPAPTPAADNGDPRPHRTRILFYRQLD